MEILNSLNGFNLSITNDKGENVYFENAQDFFGTACKILQSETGDINVTSLKDGKTIAVDIYNDEMRATIVGSALDVFMAIVFAHRNGAMDT